jgi:hypothetical protein
MVVAVLIKHEINSTSASTIDRHEINSVTLPLCIKIAYKSYGSSDIKQVITFNILNHMIYI